MIEKIKKISDVLNTVSVSGEANLNAQLWAIQAINQLIFDLEEQKEKEAVTNGD